jgi:hypothetical protein
MDSRSLKATGHRLIIQLADPGGLQSKTLVYNDLITGIKGSNPSEGMDVRMLCLLCVL